jgi:serine/threonine-protein kinase
MPVSIIVPRSMLERLGHYKILDWLGAGGIGDVYRARDTRHGRTVALKVVRDDIVRTPELYRCLVDRARAAAACSHPNIAALYEVGEDNDRLFLAYEFVPGDSLQKVIAGRPLNPRRAIDLAASLADAVAEAHAMAIEVGALTAAAIVVTPKGSPKILDIGLACVAGSTVPGGPTASEARQRTASNDTRALGVLLYQMLSGQISGLEPPAMDKAWPAELQAVVGKALSTVEGDAYESPATLAAELRAVAAILDVRTSAAEPIRMPIVVRDRPPRRGWIVAALLVAALLAAGWLLVGVYR